MTPAPGLSPGHPDHAIDLLAPEHPRYEQLARAVEKGPDWVLDEIEGSGITGRGGAGFPAHIKWRAIRKQPVKERYVLLNADEGEPGTFKDREVMLRRPHLVIEGLAIAAHALEAGAIYTYVRGEFGRARGHLKDVTWGMGEASICGLGQAAFYPLDSAMKYFPEEFGLDRTR